MTLSPEHPISVLLSTQKLRVCWKDGGEERHLVGAVQGAEAGNLLIRPSSDGPDEPRPDRGQIVAIEAPTELGIFEIAAQILSTDQPDRVAVRLNGKMRRVQRRQFERVQITGVISQGWVLDATNTPIEELTASLIDLSGGGVKFATQLPLKAGACVRLRLDLLGDPVLEPTVVIVESLNTTTGVIPRYESRGYFRDFSEADRDRILRFVTEEPLARHPRHS